MKLIKYLPLLFLFAVSCESETDISSVLQKKRLVVNALLNDKDQVKIWVSHSTGLRDSVKPAAIENAQVIIQDEGGNQTVCTYNMATDYYESTLVPESGKSYSILVKAPDYPDASAVIRIPGPAGFLKPVWKDSTSVDSFGFPQGLATVRLDDNGSEKNYYRITLYYYDELLAEWFSLSPASTDAEINNQAIKTDDGGIIFSDMSFNGNSRSIGFITPFGFSSQTPKFLIITENLSEEYYRYFKSLDDYRTGGGVFSEPTAVYTNITKGLGIAAGSSISRDTIP